MASMCDHIPRVRVTRGIPFDPTSRYPYRVVWFGSIARGWVGKPLHPGSFRNVTWRYGRA